MEEFVRGRSVGRLGFYLFEIKRNVEIDSNACKFTRLTNQICIVAEGLTIGFVLYRFPTLKSIFYRPKLLNDLYCAFRANAGCARDVVDGVAHQTEQVNKLVCGYTKLILHPRFITPFYWRHGLFAFHDLRVLPHANDQRISYELTHVFVV